MMKKLPNVMCIPVRPLAVGIWLLILACFLSSGAALASEIQDQQPVKVAGVISDETGQPLPGATIMEKGTQNGAVTGTDGQFQLMSRADGILVVSFVGYETQEIPVSGQTHLDVQLQVDMESLEEVVVVGYGEQKKETLTGSISQLKGKELVASPQPNVTNSLAGRFPGIISNNRSGEPGYDGSNIYIRGLSTTGSNDVLVVVDGVPGQLGGLSRLNPNDIESITVLKDASAAIYGSRAANGVILVTTKKGDLGKPLIDYSFQLGFSSPTRLPHMANAATYATIRNEIAYYDNPDGGMNQIYTVDEIQKFSDGSDPLNYPNTNWAKATLKNTAAQYQHNLSIRGGTENVKYFVSFGRLFQDGLYKHGVTKYDQYSVRSNLDAKITKALSASLALSGRQEDRIYPTTSAADIFRSIYRAYPTVLDRYPNGLPTTGIENNNPVMLVTNAGGTSKNPLGTFNGILKGKYEILAVPGLYVDGFFGLDKTWNFTKTFATPYSVYNYDSDTDTYTAVVTGGSNSAATLDESQVNVTQITKNIKVNYQKMLGMHSLNTFIGYEQSTYHSETFGASRINYPTTETPELSEGGAASSDSDNYGSSYNYNRRSFITRVAYNFKEKYMAEFQMRVDGSSNFPKGSRYGFFPAISAGWRISEESWFKSSVSVINDLKIRVSYGQLGNDNIDAFQFYNNYSFNNSYVIGGATHAGIDLTKLANENITWEVAKKTDVGINAVFLRDFTLELTYFQQKRTDILTTRNASIPGVSGIVNPYGGTLVPDENIGKVNSAGMEAALGYRKNLKDFWYGISGNLTFAKSKIVFIDEASTVLSHQQQTGRPLSTYLLYKSTGIFKKQADLDAHVHLDGAQLGDLIYADYNGDGEITSDDMVRTKYSNIPEITYGFTLSGGWKSIDLSLLFSGQALVSQYVLPEAGTVGNFYSSWADHRWSPTHLNGSYPRVDTRASSSVNGGLYANDFWLNNASFLRLKNVALGYTFPTDFATKLKITSLRFYVNAFNLFTLSQVKDYDPEGSSSSGQFYPQQRIISIGADVRF